jgi:hypothetical protein
VLSDFSSVPRLDVHRLWGSRVCQVRGASARCKARFEDLTLGLSVKMAGAGIVRLKLSIVGFDYCSPGLTPPATVGLLQAGGSRGGTISTCVVRITGNGVPRTDCAN